jgi:hypothetical protein
MRDIVMATTIGGTVVLALVVDVAALVGFLWRNGSGR